MRISAVETYYHSPPLPLHTSLAVRVRGFRHVFCRFKTLTEVENVQILYE